MYLNDPEKPDSPYYKENGEFDWLYFLGVITYYTWECIRFITIIMVIIISVLMAFISVNNSRKLD